MSSKLKSDDDDTDGIMAVDGGSPRPMQADPVFETRGRFFFARHYASAVLVVARCPSIRVCHKPVLYRNSWTDRAGFWL